MSDRITSSDWDEEPFAQDMNGTDFTTPKANMHESDSVKIEKETLSFPEFKELHESFDTASLLVDDIILKKYLHHLNEMEIIPLDNSLKKISDIRIYKIQEMVYQDKEYSTYKLASVFNSVQNLNCSVFIIADSDGEKTQFYIGVRSLDDERTATSLGDTLCNALKGQFPGTKTFGKMEDEARGFLDKIRASGNKIASVSCIGQNRDADFKDNETYIQGLEKFALAMQGQKYTAIILAKSTPQEQLEELRHSYETIYTQLSPFATMQLSYGTNTAVSISETLSRGTTTGTNWSENWSESHGTNWGINRGTSHSVTTPDVHGTIAKATVKAALGVAALATAPMTDGASIAVAAGLAVAGSVVEGVPIKNKNDGFSEGRNFGENELHGVGGAKGGHRDEQQGYAKQNGETKGKSESTQLTLQNRTLIDTMERIEEQLQRLTNCESMGMWECAAYFLSDSQATAEMAAGTYKALIRGEKSGLESSAINFWGGDNARSVSELNEYLMNFLHPVFSFNDEIHVTAASLVSGNELAIQMGLPRHSVCGFPVIEHAEFGREVVKYRQGTDDTALKLGAVYSMGEKSNTPVMLDRNSLTMHTFVTGSTGAGKSNTVYDLLYLLRRQENIPFLVIEPAKGEYKHIFGGYPDVSVYGTNPLQSELLELNPFSFHNSIHVLEHIDRLVEIFNACWPMYAAMPAVLKDAIEQSYRKSGWDLNSSICTPLKFPTFRNLLAELPKVMERSAYSADTKSDYSGALVTRIHSLTNGINGQVLCSAVMPEQESEKLFDHSTIVDLSRVGSSETKSLLMGILVMKLQEYRMHGGKMNASLSHITVLEEAHNLLRRTSDAQSQESSNLQGKSVEMIANAIAEMRTYGEGFIIADQAPGLLDESIIRNTNTKIVLRLPDEDDRMLVGKAMTLTDSQITELTRLPVGVAAVFQNDWIQPVLCQFEAFPKDCQKPCPPYDDTPRLNAIRKFLYRLYEIDDHEELEQEEVDAVYKWLDHCRMDENGYALVKDMLVRKRKLRRNEKASLTGILFDSERIIPLLRERHNQKDILNMLCNMHRIQDAQIAEKAMMYMRILADKTENGQDTPEQPEGRVR